MELRKKHISIFDDILSISSIESEDSGVYTCWVNDELIMSLNLEVMSVIVLQYLQKILFWFILIIF